MSRLVQDTSDALRDAARKLARLERAILVIGDLRPDLVEMFPGYLRDPYGFMLSDKPARIDVDAVLRYADDLAAVRARDAQRERVERVQAPPVKATE